MDQPSISNNWIMVCMWCTNRWGTIIFDSLQSMWGQHASSSRGKGSGWLVVRRWREEGNLFIPAWRRADPLPLGVASLCPAAVRCGRTVSRGQCPGQSGRWVPAKSPWVAERGSRSPGQRRGSLQRPRCSGSGPSCWVHCAPLWAPAAAFPAAGLFPAGLQTHGPAQISGQERDTDGFSYHPSWWGQTSVQGISPTSSDISRRALLLLSHRDRYMAVSFSSFLIFLVIWIKTKPSHGAQITELPLPPFHTASPSPSPV